MALEEGLALEESIHRHEKMKQLLQRSDVPPPEKSYHFCGNVKSLLRRSRDTFAKMSNHSSAEVGILLRKNSFVPPEEFIHSPRESDMSGSTT